MCVTQPLKNSMKQWHNCVTQRKDLKKNYILNKNVFADGCVKVM